MCGANKHQHMYNDDKNIMKIMFPEVVWDEKFLCEPCAKREAGKKRWSNIKKQEKSKCLTDIKKQ